MATRLFFHAASNALTGTFPTGEQSSLSATWLCSGANTLRTMGSITGVSQASLAGSNTTTTTLQNAFCGFFCSNTFDVNQSVGGGGQTVTLNIANAESSNVVNFGTGLKFNLYVWRPSTGAKVGTVGDGLALTGVAEPSAINSIRVNAGTNAATTLVNALAGDVLICEIWQGHSSSNGTVVSTNTIYYDGTTVNTTVNAIVTSQASFLDLSADTLTFGTPAGGTISAAFSNTLASVALSGVGSSPKVGTFSNTLGSVTLSGIGNVPEVGTFANTLADVTLSATGLVGVTVAQFSNTLAGLTLSGVGAIPEVGTFSNTLASIGLSTAGSVPAAGQFSNTLASATLTGVGAVPISSTFNNTLAALTLTGVGTVSAPGAATGTFSNTLASVALSATGTVASATPATGTYSNTLGALTLLGQGTAGFPAPPLPQPTSSAGSGGAQGQRKRFRIPEMAEPASPVDKLFDNPPQAVPPPARSLSPEKVIKHNTLMLDSVMAAAPAVTPLPEIKPTTILEPEDDTDELMMLFAMLV